MNGIEIVNQVLEPAAASVEASFMFGKRWESALATIKESTVKWIHIEALYEERVNLSQMTTTVTFSGLVVTQDRVDSAPTAARNKSTKKANVPRATSLNDMWNLYIDFINKIRESPGCQVTEFGGVPAIQVLNAMTGYIVNFTIVSRHKQC